MKTTQTLALTLAVLLTGALAGSALAGPRGKVVNERQSNQSDRVQQGIQSGELNRREAVRLKQNQRQINRYERRSRNDGNGISAKEANRLDNMQVRQSKAIYNQKHDEQDRH